MTTPPGAARIWSTSTLHKGKVSTFRAGFGTDVSTVAVSPNGRVILTANLEDVRLWNLESGQIARVYRTPSEQTSAEFSPDGQTVVTVGDDGIARIWDPVTGLHRSLPGGFGLVTSVAWDPRGRLIVTAGEDGEAVVWDPLNWRVGTVRAIRTFRPGPVTSVRFANDGKTILTATVGAATPVVAWNAATGRRSHAYRAGSKVANALAFSPDLRLVLVDDGDGTARIQDLRAGKSVAKLTGHHGKVKYAAFSPNGKLALTVDEAGTTRLWNVEDERAVERRLSGASNDELMRAAERRVYRPLAAR